VVRQASVDGRVLRKPEAPVLKLRYFEFSPTDLSSVAEVFVS
jgi:hypothetical protein